MAVNDRERGIIVKGGEKVILLPAGPIRGKVKGGSGREYEQVLVDDPDLGHPTQRIQESGIVYSHPYEE